MFKISGSESLIVGAVSAQSRCWAISLGKGRSLILRTREVANPGPSCSETYLKNNNICELKCMIKVLRAPPSQEQG